MSPAEQVGAGLGWGCRAEDGDPSSCTGGVGGTGWGGFWVLVILVLGVNKFLRKGGEKNPRYALSKLVSGPSGEGGR